jgi:hypothetical protein
MQRHTVFFIIVNTLHVTGGFSAHHQDLKNCTHSIWYMSSVLAATASVDNNKEYCITLHLVGYTWKNTLTMHSPVNVKALLYVFGEAFSIVNNNST